MWRNLTLINFNWNKLMNLFFTKTSFFFIKHSKKFFKQQMIKKNLFLVSTSPLLAIVVHGVVALGIVRIIAQALFDVPVKIARARLLHDAFREARQILAAIVRMWQMHWLILVELGTAHLSVLAVIYLRRRQRTPDYRQT